MITVVISGGVGNQLFQYATARAAAIRLKTDVQAIDEVNGERMYSLGLFKNIAITSIISNLAQYSELRPNPIIQESVSHPYQSVSAVTSCPNPCTFWGYWQTEKYFTAIESLIRDELQPGKPSSLFTQDLDRQIRAQGNKSVALSIRRGDYLNRPYHGVLPMEFYNKAIEIVASQIQNPHFFVFSDEPEWLKNNFKIPYSFTISGNFEPTTLSHLGREDSQLNSMSLCQHAILANSSFSWWGAWLNPERYNRIVITPERWYEEGKVDTQGLIPERWIKI